jgi:hypothetical protein
MGGFTTKKIVNFVSMPGVIGRNFNGDYESQKKKFDRSGTV